MKLQFIKMQALGNDFVIIDDRDSKLEKLNHLSEKLCDRRFGIGADQLLILSHSDKADFGMRIFNADGSEVEMCGNGIRCLGKYIWDHILRCDESAFAKKYSQTIDSIDVETLAGIMTVYKRRDLFKIKMGEPILEPEKIPVKIRQKSEDKKIRSYEDKKSQLLNFSTSQLPNSLRVSGSEPVINYPLKIKDKIFKITCVSMGNPHAVIIVKNIQSVPLKEYGPLIENHNIFPNRTNVEFIQIINQTNIKMRVWERGAGETMACGTGAAASVVASNILGLTGRKVTVHLPGGKLLIQWSAKDNNVYMTGPAITVFYGRIEI